MSESVNLSFEFDENDDLDLVREDNKFNYFQDTKLDNVKGIRECKKRIFEIINSNDFEIEELFISGKGTDFKNFDEVLAFKKDLLFLNVYNTKFEDHKVTAKYINEEDKSWNKYDSYVSKEDKDLYDLGRNLIVEHGLKFVELKNNTMKPVLSGDLKLKMYNKSILEIDNNFDFYKKVERLIKSPDDYELFYKYSQDVVRLPLQLRLAEETMTVDNFENIVEGYDSAISMFERDIKELESGKVPNDYIESYIGAVLNTRDWLGIDTKDEYNNQVNYLEDYEKLALGYGRSEAQLVYDVKQIFDFENAINVKNKQIDNLKKDKSEFISNTHKYIKLIKDEAYDYEKIRYPESSYDKYEEEKTHDELDDIINDLPFEVDDEFIRDYEKSTKRRLDRLDRMKIKENDEIDDYDDEMSL